ncbi:unnamed protein product [Caenorhabditis sp. 36 PRJEB53466]|nr:unnamed protein product [Caenorhabditis sp. 36 PRJEB53466]
MRRSVLACFVLLTSATVGAVSVAKSTDNDIVLKVSANKHSSRDTYHFSGEWLESPWGDLYQFRAGDQNWLTAREHCLSLNADLAAIRNVEQLDWILSHYAPLSSRFAQRLVQIGLYAPEGQTHEWKWLDGKEINTTLQWSSGEPYDHSMEGRERCGLLNVEKRQLDDVDCESTPSDHHALRYICQRTSENHKQQQRSNNYIWQKIENLFSFFGIGSTATPHNATVSNDYEDEVVKNETKSAAVKFSDSDEQTSSEEEEEVIKTLAALPKIEGSGESTTLKELQEPEGSGQIVEKKAIETPGELVEGVDEGKLDKMINKMEEMIKSIDDLTVPPASSLERTTVGTPVKQEEEKKKKEEDEPAKGFEENKVSENIEGDFDQTKSKDMPKADIVPPKEEDCDEDGSGSGEEQEDEKDDDDGKKLELAPEKEDKIKEFLGVLRLFLDRAEHGDLRKLLDDQSGKTLLERMKNAVREANKREFEMLESMEIAKKSGEEEKLTAKKDQMSTEEQKDLYKKISSAVMKAAKEQKKEEKVHDEPAMEKFNIAKEKVDKEDESEGTLEVLKSATEGKEPTEKNRDGEKKTSEEEPAQKDEPKLEEEVSTAEPEKKKEEATNTSAAPEKVETTTEEVKEEKKEEEVTTKAESEKKEEPTSEAPKIEEEKTSAEPEKVETTTEEVKEKKKEEEEVTTEAKPSEKPAEAEEDELEASGQEEDTTTSESTIVAVKEVSAEEIEKPTKLEAKQDSDDVPLTAVPSTEAPTTTSTAPSSSAFARTTTVPKKTTPVTVAVRKVSEKEMEKLSKLEATEKVTLLPPLPTFTFPTLAPFTFPTLPTLPTTKPTPAPKVPTLEEILGNLNDQFKKLLSPPKPLPK